MQVILLAKVLGLGNIDDIVNVADGYAANFLFPRHLAVSVSPKALNDLKADRTRRVKAAEQELKVQQSLASRLDGFPLTITEKTNEAGFLYAAVNAQKISEALKKSGFDVSKNNIAPVAIKEPGEYKVKVKLRHGLEANLNVIVMGVENKK